MTKKARIAQLEQQVARLEARIMALESRPYAVPSYSSWLSEPFPRVTWTQPNMIYWDNNLPNYSSMGLSNAN